MSQKPQSSQFVIIAGDRSTAVWLWYVCIVTWVMLIYTFFGAATLQADKPDLAHGINGAWLIAVVATQAVSILGTLVSPKFGGNSEQILFFTLSMYLLGCMFYILIISLIFYRFLFFRTAARRSDPALLDQHGSGGDHHPGRSDTDAQRAALSVSARDNAVPQRVHAVFLGYRYMVDSDVGYSGFLAAYLQTLPPDLSSPVLGHGLPPRYVYNLYPTIIKSDRIDVSEDHSNIFCLRGSRCVVRDFRRLASQCCGKFG